jgi:integrase
MTLPIDLRLPRFGRFQIRSGTTDPRKRAAMREMFRDLARHGRRDLLRDVEAGRLGPLELYTVYRTHGLEGLPAGPLLRPLEAAWAEWLRDKVLRPRTRRDYTGAGARLCRLGRSAQVRDLPDLLTAHRLACSGRSPRTFTKDRAAALSLVASLVGERDRCYGQCARVPTLPVPPERKQRTNPQTVAEVHALAERFGARGQAHHAATLWAYCLTGMRPEELHEEDGNTWTLERDRVRVDGTKTGASRRVLPRVGILVKPRTTSRAFAKALLLVSTGLDRLVEHGGKGKRATVRTAELLRRASRMPEAVRPYDLRRSYQQWLHLARIPVFRQDYYMAHGPKDLNALYSRAKECEQYLAEDGAALGALVGAPMAMRVVR